MQEQVKRVTFDIQNERDMHPGRPERQCVDALKRPDVVVIRKCDVELENADMGVQMNDE